MSEGFIDWLEENIIWGLSFNYKTLPFVKNIVNIAKNNSDLASPGVAEILDLLDKCKTIEDFQGENTTEYYAFLHELNCGSKENPEIKANPFDQFVFALFLYYSQNLEKALFYSASAGLKNSGYQFIYLTLYFFILWEMNAPERPNDMLILYQDREPLDYYYKESWKYLAQNNMDMFDHYVQRINASGWHPTIFFDMARFDMARLITRARLKEWDDAVGDWGQIIKKRFFVNSDDEGVDNDITKWEDDENKRGIARFICKLCIENNIGRPHILDIGCHAGTLLNLIEKEMFRFNLVCSFTGIEQDEKAVEIGREKYPYINFHTGMHGLAYEMDINGDILLLSYTCLLNTTETIQEIFNWARGKFKYIVLADDIVNIYGDFPVLRRYYMIHPFEKMLKEAGFEITYKLPLERYTVAANGIICARCLENS